MQIVDCQQPQLWDRYVTDHPRGGPFHLFGWKQIFENVYGLPTFYWVLVSESEFSASSAPPKGLCALVFLKSPGKRRRLIGLPYLDGGGILADDPACEELFLAKALKTAQQYHANWIELRQTTALGCLVLPPLKQMAASDPIFDLVRYHQVSTHKAASNGRCRAIPNS